MLIDSVLAKIMRHLLPFSRMGKEGFILPLKTEDHSNRAAEPTKNCKDGAGSRIFRTNE